MKGPHIRNAAATDLEGCYEVEIACWPPEEAALKTTIAKRITTYPQGFFIAERDGRVIGMINGCCTNSEELGDEALKQLVGHDVDGRNMVIFALGVLPEYRRQGIAARLIRAFVELAVGLKKHKVLLICKAYLVPYYGRFGFVDAGPSASTHGGAAWRQMSLTLDRARARRTGAGAV